MTYKIFISETLKNDLRSIIKYMSHDLSSLNYAYRLQDEIINTIYSLDRMPNRFPVYRNMNTNSLSLRAVPIRNYLLFYTVDEKNKIVNVLRVIYGKQNLECQFHDRLPLY